MQSWGIAGFPAQNYLVDAGQGLAVLAGMTWDPANKNSNVTLSNGNLTATTSTTGYSGVRATVGKTSGKWYFEITINTKGGDPTIGICSDSFLITGTNFIGNNASSIGYFPNSGNVIFNGSVVATTSLAAAGDVIGITFDASAKTMAIYKNNTLLTSTTQSVSGTTFYPAIDPTGSSPIGTLTINSTLVYAPPSGYTQWM